MYKKQSNKTNKIYIQPKKKCIIYLLIYMFIFFAISNKTQAPYRWRGCVSCFREPRKVLKQCLGKVDDVLSSGEDAQHSRHSKGARRNPPLCEQGSLGCKQLLKNVGDLDSDNKGCWLSRSGTSCLAQPLFHHPVRIQFLAVSRHYRRYNY